MEFSKVERFILAHIFKGLAEEETKEKDQAKFEDYKDIVLRGEKGRYDEIKQYIDYIVD